MKILICAFTILSLVGIVPERSHAQANGMSKATAKLLVSDLIEAGFSPQIREQGGAFFITVSVDPDKASTAAQVQSFANARSVTARVLSVQFE